MFIHFWAKDMLPQSISFVMEEGALQYRLLAKSCSLIVLSGERSKHHFCALHAIHYSS